MLTDSEFEKRISEIDKEQRNENIPIYARPLNAIHRYGLKYNISMILGGFHLFIPADKYDSVNLARTITDWYDKKYGDRVKKDFSLGYVAILIAGSVYKMKIPLIFGKAIFGADGQLKLNHTLVQNGIMLLNVVIFIEELTSDLSSELTQKEEGEILQIYNFASEMFSMLSNEYNKNALCISAREDFRYAVESLMNDQFNIGHSKWASFQATEKILKSILQRNNISFNKNHNLREITESLKKIGFPGVSNDLINTIQCNAGVRYGEIPFKLEDAIKAHHYSIYLCKEYLKSSI